MAQNVGRLEDFLYRTLMNDAPRAAGWRWVPPSPENQFASSWEWSDEQNVSRLLQQGMGRTPQIPLNPATVLQQHFGWQPPSLLESGFGPAGSPVGERQRNAELMQRWSELGNLGIGDFGTTPQDYARSLGLIQNPDGTWTNTWEEEANSLAPLLLMAPMLPAIIGAAGAGAGAGLGDLGLFNAGAGGAGALTPVAAAGAATLPVNPFAYTMPGGLTPGIEQLGGQSFIEASLPGGALTPTGALAGAPSLTPFDFTMTTPGSNLGTIPGTNVPIEQLPAPVQSLTPGANPAGDTAVRQSLAQRLISQGLTPQNAIDLVAGLAPAVIGAFASDAQADTLRSLAEQSRAERAPFLGAATGWLANPQSYFEGPGRATLDSVLRRLSVQGNPIGVPTSMAIATQAGMRDWRDAVTGFGNLGLAGQDTRAQLGTAAAGADANLWNALGYGARSIFGTPESDEDLWRGFMRGFSLSPA